ncbi:hypothetical protein [Ferruginibacter profundus]
MKSTWFKKALPHLIAIGIFLLVSVIFCKPALDSSLTMQQSDITQWQGMSHQLMEKTKAEGRGALWATNMFSGMPSYQITYPTPWNPIDLIHHIFTLWLPKPINFFFLMCISMYLLLSVIKLRPWTAIIGALGFAFSSFTAMATVAGHDTQMLTLAYVPATLAGMLLVYEKKYLWGFTLTALFTMMQLGMNHQQISYYFFIIAVIMTIAYFINWVKQKQLAHAGKAIGLVAVAAAIGVGVNILNLWVNADYTASSKRGGMLVMDKKDAAKDNVTKDSKTTGLQIDYAFQWSYGKMESFSLMFPGIKGYGMHVSERDGEQEIFPKLDDKSHVYKQVDEKINAPQPRYDAEKYALSLSQSIYWGDQPFTVGPVYLGAIICFLGILGLFLLDNKHKWWILACTILGIMMAMGKNLPGFNGFLFEHLPLYNKFRVPTMTLVIPQIVVPILAALTLDYLITHQAEAETWKKFKLGAIATAGIFIIVIGIYFTSDFSAENKNRTKAINEMLQSKSQQEMQEKYNTINSDKNLQPLVDNSVYEQQVLNNRLEDTEAKGILSALRKDRASFLGKDILVSLVYVLLAAAFLVLYLKNKLNATVVIAGVTLVAFIELFSFDIKYLNDKSFASKADFEAAEFPMSKADQEILQDKDPNYRVLDMSKGDPYQQSRSSYYHKTIGGYSAAKLAIYDDLITYQLTGGTPNANVLNMLNTKYIIQPGQNQGEAIKVQNPGALGNCWFVKAVTYVNGAVEEMKALNDFNPKDTAIVDKSYQAKIGSFTAPDSAAYIKQTAFDNDAIKYESNSAAPQLAVFSEIFYKDWNAYIDGKKTDIIKTDYVLRALMLPAGKHSIEFKLEPAAYINGSKLGVFFTWLMIALLIGTIGWEIKKTLGNKTATTNG